MVFLLSRYNYGDSVVNYFIFAICVFIYNSILFVTSLGITIPNYIHSSYNSNSTYINYISMSSTNVSTLWRIISSFLIVSSVVFPFVYIFIAFILNDYDTPTTYETKLTRCKLVSKIIITYLIMFVLLLISAAINIGVNYLTLLDLNIYIISLLASVIIYLINYTYELLNTAISKYDGINSQNYLIFNTLLFKLLNVWSSTLITQVVNTPCVIDRITLQIVTNLIVDLTLNNSKEITYMIYKRTTVGKIEEFNSTFEYYEFIYRQYMIYLSLSACPIVTILGVISSLIEIIIDYIKVKHFIKVTLNVYPNIHVIFTLMLICAILAIINPLTGNVYILIGRCLVDNCYGCKVYNT